MPYQKKIQKNISLGTPINGLLSNHLGREALLVTDPTRAYLKNVCYQLTLLMNIFNLKSQICSESKNTLTLKISYAKTRSQLGGIGGGGVRGGRGDHERSSR